MISFVTTIDGDVFSLTFSRTTAMAYLEPSFVSIPPTNHESAFPGVLICAVLLYGIAITINYLCNKSRLH